MMKNKKILFSVIILLLSMVLASCAGIGDGALNNDHSKQEKGGIFTISSDKRPTINDYVGFTCFISSFDSEGEQKAEMELANGGSRMMYEYFTESEYQRSEAEERSVDYKNCVTFSFKEKSMSSEGDTIYGFCCDVRVYFDDYVVYTYYSGDKSIELKGFLDGAYDESSKAYSDAIAFREREAGFSFDSLIIQVGTGKTYTALDFPEIDCISVKRMMHGGDGTVWWVLDLDSSTETEVLDALDKLQEREDIILVQHNYIYTLS